MYPASLVTTITGEGEWGEWGAGGIFEVSSVLKIILQYIKYYVFSHQCGRKYIPESCVWTYGSIVSRVVDNSVDDPFWNVGNVISKRLERMKLQNWIPGGLTPPPGPPRWDGYATST